MESKRVLCSSCDIYCQVQVDVDDGRVVRVKALDPRPLRSNICMKGVHAPSGFAHPDRVLHPLKRAGERGEGRWQRVTWDEALDEIAERHPHHMGEPRFRKYEQTGFATPSGKVELVSSALDELGFDPRPYWREEPAAGPEYPLRLFTGLRDDSFFQTGHRHIEALRRRCPEPRMFITAGDAAGAGLEDGAWAEVSTRQGGCRLRVSVRDDMPDGLVRVPHGWWLPEVPEGDGGLSGAWDHADAQLCADDPDFLDAEQGIPHLKGIPCVVRPAAA